MPGPYQPPSAALDRPAVSAPEGEAWTRRGLGMLIAVAAARITINVALFAMPFVIEMLVPDETQWPRSYAAVQSGVSIFSTSTFVVYVVALVCLARGATNRATATWALVLGLMSRVASAGVAYVAPLASPIPGLYQVFQFALAALSLAALTRLLQVEARHGGMQTLHRMHWAAWGITVFGRASDEVMAAMGTYDVLVFPIAAHALGGMLHTILIAVIALRLRAEPRRRPREGAPLSTPTEVGGRGDAR